ncbi:MAG: iron-sulfur cluster assembly protein [Bacteroidota bacterium]
MENMILKNKIISAIKTVYDPEIPVNVYDLGMIYEINISESKDVKIIMTLTSPNCPEAERIPPEIVDAIKYIEDVKSVDVEITFDPPWTKDLISPDAMLELGLM